MNAPSVKLILASGSPQRRALLQEAGYDFEIVLPAENAECGVCSRETPPEHAARMAYQKAADVAARTPAGLVVACDTIAECLGQVLGKPADAAHARQMLKLLSGREHRVYSGLCLWRKPQDRRHVQVATTVLRMDSLSEEQIDEYVASGLWQGKAGAFGYQDRLDWLHIAAGSQSNVIGLPLELLREMLREEGPKWA